MVTAKGLHWIWIGGIGALFILMGCAPDPIPRPHGYFRIETPDLDYAEYTHSCGPQFKVPAYAKIELLTAQVPESNCWFNVYFPPFSAKLHCSLIEVQKSEELHALIEDAHQLVYAHDAKATGIAMQPFHFSEHAVSGLLFDLEGPVASPLQFFASDSTNHFIRGSLYFDHEPNPDSIRPALNRIRQDVVHMIETFQWNAL